MNNGIFPFEDEKDACLPSNPTLSLNSVPEIKRNIVHLEPGEVCAENDCDYKADCSGLDPKRDRAFVCDVESLKRSIISK